MTVWNYMSNFIFAYTNDILSHTIYPIQTGNSIAEIDFVCSWICFGKVQEICRVQNIPGFKVPIKCKVRAV